MSDKRKPGPVSRFLVFCSGADPDVLEKCFGRTRAKYAALGGLVLTPAVLAVASSYYFFSTIFKAQPVVSVLGSLAWGLIVFNIDRYIVMSLRKGEQGKKFTATLALAGRLLLAAFLAYTIASALVLRFFDKNIQEYIYFHNQAKKEAIASRYDSMIEKKENGIAALNKEMDTQSGSLSPVEGSSTEVQALRKEIDHHYSLLADEEAGISKRTHLHGNGKVAKAIAAHIKYLQGQLKGAIEREKKERARNARFLEWRKQEMAAVMARDTGLINDKRNEIAKIEQAKEHDLKTFDAKAADDFLARSNALEALARKNPNIRKWNWLLTLLLISIDILAITLKIIWPKDDYDWRVESEQLAMEADELMKRDVLAATKEDRERVEIQRVKNRALQGEMQENVEHGIKMLGLYRSLSDMKMKETLDFVKQVNAHKREFDKEGDEDDQEIMSEELAKHLRNYFERSGEVAGAASHFFRHSFNGKGSSDGTPADKFSETDRHADQWKGGG